MISQHILKTKLHNELQLRFNEFNESCQAIELLAASFDSVNKVSTAIASLISTHQDIVLKTIQDTPKIAAELREPYFGCLYTPNEKLTPDKILFDIVSILSNNNANLEKIMQIHCIFVYRIYDIIEKNNELTVSENKSFCQELFTENCREKRKKEATPTFNLGIASNSVLAKRLPKHDTPHLRALDIYKPNPNAFFISQAHHEAIPVVCGPSGHTASLLLGAKLYGNLSDGEFDEYTQACFAFLTAGGNHSRHEVMHVANQFKHKK